MQHLLRNSQTMPASSVVPVLQYPDVEKAINWLCNVFGFTERWRAGDHRAQLAFGNGAVVITKKDESQSTTSAYSLMVRVENVNNHYTNACKHNAWILSTPEIFPYGEKQYTVADPGGYVWMFTETVTDVNVEEWGGKLPG